MMAICPFCCEAEFEHPDFCCKGCQGRFAITSPGYQNALKLFARGEYECVCSLSPAGKVSIPEKILAAHSLLHSGNYSKALAVYRKISGWEEFPEIVFNLALIYSSQKKFEDAQSCISRINEGDCASFFDRSIYLKMIYGTQEVFLREVCKLKMIILFNCEDLYSALHIFEQNQELLKFDFAILNIRAEIFFRLQEYQKVIECYEEILCSFPVNTDLSELENNLAITYSRVRAQDKARDLLIRIVGKSPQDNLFVHNLYCLNQGCYDQMKFVFSFEDSNARSRNLEENLFHGDHIDTLMMARSQSMQQVLLMARKAGKTMANILITGENGTGKELISSYVQLNSLRRDKPFVIINCASLPANLLESELFGYEKGAFTGADSDKPGKLEMADGGTVFLDEIAEIPLALQSKLLRFVQYKEIQTIGNSQTKCIDVRIIAATNVDLEQAVAENRFRRDLFYRLNVIPLHLPGLRERTEDLPFLIQYFFQYFCSKNHVRIFEYSSEIQHFLLNYHWPGNIRELQNVLERLVVLGEERFIFPERSAQTAHSDQIELSDSLELVLWEKKLISAALKRAGSKQEAASLLGIDPSTLWRKMKRFQME